MAYNTYIIFLVDYGYPIAGWCLGFLGKDNYGDKKQEWYVTATRQCSHQLCWYFLVFFMFEVLQCIWAMTQERKIPQDPLWEKGTRQWFTSQSAHLRNLEWVVWGDRGGRVERNWNLIFLLIDTIWQHQHNHLYMLVIATRNLVHIQQQCSRYCNCFWAKNARQNYVRK